MSKTINITIEERTGAPPYRATARVAGQGRGVWADGSSESAAAQAAIQHLLGTPPISFERGLPHITEATRFSEAIRFWKNAAAASATVSLHYRDREGNVTFRNIQPSSVKDLDRTNPRVVAYDLTHGGVRSFLIRGVISATSL